jgi:hypothetical protein
VAEDFVTHFSEFAASFSGEDSLSSEERRQMSLRNLAMSKASKSRKKRKSKQAEPKEQKLTEAERRSREQARIREERESRSALSEENRRQAAIGGAEAPAPPPEPERKKKTSRPAEPLTAPMIADSDIDVDIPDDGKKEQSEAKSKKKKNTKQQTESKSRTSQGSRYTGTANNGTSEHPNRITTGGAVTLGILTGILIGTVIYGRVQTNEVYTKIAALQAEYDDLTARNISMRSEMEGKLTVKKIEEYAEDELGLRPLNQSQIEYIQLQTEDEVTVTEPEDNFFVTVNDYLVSIWEFLRGK